MMADLTQQILELASKSPPDLAEADRHTLLQASYKLSDALENPLEKMMRLFLVRDSRFFCLVPMPYSDINASNN